MQGKYIGEINGYDLYKTESIKSPLAVAKLKNGKLVMLAGRLYPHFNSEELEIMFHHEIGHVQNNHITLEENPIEYEYIADIYAADICGYDRSIALLEKSIDFYSSEEKIEIIKKRISNLIHKSSMGIES